MMPRTLRAKVALTIAALTAIGLLAAGALTFALFRQSTLREADRRLMAGAPALARIVQATSERSGSPPRLEGRFGQRLLTSTGATVVALRGSDGTVRTAWVLGLADEQQADKIAAMVPAVSAVDLAAASDRDTLVSADGYRTALVRVEGGIVQISAPDAAVHDSVRRLLELQALVGAAVLGAVAGSGWLLVRRELRPLEQVARSAERITAGEPLSQVRPALAPAARAGAEVGRVAEALDGMIAQVDSSLTATQRSEQQLRAFVLDAAHELRTPLTSIRGYAELFTRGLADHPDDLAVALRRISQESVRLGALLDDLLLLARLNGSPDDVPLHRVPVDLRTLVRDAAADARVADPLRRVTEETPLDPITAPVDADRIRQLLGNLVRNALVHTPTEAPLALSVRTVGAPRRWAEIRIADSGPGIAPEDRVRIFNRFARLDPGRSRDAGGSGLGLAIVAAIAAAHGGSVWVEDTDGGGVTLCVALPLDEAPQLRTERAA